MTFLNKILISHCKDKQINILSIKTLTGGEEKGVKALNKQAPFLQI